MLPAHEWDDDVHRLAIHMTFDRWFASFMSKPQNKRQTTNLYLVLRRLTEQAAERKAKREMQAVLDEYNRALAQGELEAVV